MGNYDKIWEWIFANYDTGAYLLPEQLIFDVENQFNQDGRYFPPEAKDLIRERFQYRREYIEMQKRQDEQKQIAEVIGGGEIMESLSDEMVDDLRNPNWEMMDIDFEEYATTKETVVPPDIVKYAEKMTFFGRFTNRFKRLFRR